MQNLDLFFTVISEVWLESNERPHSLHPSFWDTLSKNTKVLSNLSNHVYFRRIYKLKHLGTSRNKALRGSLGIVCLIYSTVNRFERPFVFTAENGRKSKWPYEGGVK